MSGSYTMKDLIKLFLSKIKQIILITLACGFAAFFIAEFVLPLKYSSHISMYVQSYTDINNDSAQGYNDITKSKQLINTYIEVLKDDAVMESVGKKLMESFSAYEILENFSVNDSGNISPESLRSTITITTVTDTSALNIVATTKSPELSAAVCNELAAQADGFISSAIGVGTIKTIDTAKIYKTPVAPNVTKYTLLGIASGLIISILLVLIVDFFDNTVKSADDISKKYNKPIIGEIQDLDTDKGKKKRKTSRRRRLLINKDLPFNIEESYKSIRTNMLFSLGTAEGKVIAVSSANPSEGKSTIAANVAIAFAQTNSRVLLIDADMRKPVQHRNFRVKNKEGLSTLIINKSTAEESIKFNVISGLDLLTSGPTPPNPSELLSSEQFAEIVWELAKIYDYIIIDTPPINVVSDAMVIKDVTSGILLVMKYGSTTYEDVANCMKQIDLANANVLGIVLNQIQHHGYGSYNYKYKYKYSYYGESEKDEDNTAEG